MANPKLNPKIPDLIQLAIKHPKLFNVTLIFLGILCLAPIAKSLVDNAGSFQYRNGDTFLQYESLQKTEQIQNVKDTSRAVKTRAVTTEDLDSPQSESPLDASHAQ